MAAKRGSVPMLIWLGKNELGQADRHEHTGKDGGPIETVEKRVYDVDDFRRAFGEPVQSGNGRGHVSPNGN